MEFLDSIANVLRGIGAGMLVFFIPGYAWVRLLFHGWQAGIIEKLVLSVGLSVTLVTVSIFGMNILFHVSIKLTNELIIIVALSLLPAAWRAGTRWLRRPADAAPPTQD